MRLVYYKEGQDVANLKVSRLFDLTWHDLGVTTEFFQKLKSY